MLTMKASSPANILESDGRVWFRGAMSASELAAVERMGDRRDHPGLRLNGAAALAEVLTVDGSIVKHVSQIADGLHAVRAVWFNKTREQNWSVPWHQDRVIAVQERQSASGFTNWSCKSGMWHCEPPAGLLDSMLFVRVHLDDVSDANGALEIALGSHKNGSVAAGSADDIAKLCETEICHASRGDILVLKMLTLHRSGPSRSGVPRRALRIDFSDLQRPGPLKWAWALPPITC